MKPNPVVFYRNIVYSGDSKIYRSMFVGYLFIMYGYVEIALSEEFKHPTAKIIVLFT